MTIHIKNKHETTTQLQFVDEYQLHSLEDISQKPSAMNSEKHPTWLIQHLDCIKKALEKELIDVKKDF